MLDSQPEPLLPNRTDSADFQIRPIFSKLPTLVCRAADYSDSRSLRISMRSYMWAVYRYFVACFGFS